MDCILPLAARDKEVSHSEGGRCSWPVVDPSLVGLKRATVGRLSTLQISTVFDILDKFVSAVDLKDCQSQLSILFLT